MFASLASDSFNCHGLSLSIDCLPSELFLTLLVEASERWSIIAEIDFEVCFKLVTELVTGLIF